MWSAPPGAWETWRRCNPADAGAVTFPARAQLPGGARGQKGPRGALVHRAGQRHRPTPTDAARPVRRPAARISGDSRLFPGLMTPGTLPLSPRPLELCPGLGGRTVALRGSRQRSPGRDRLTAAAGWLPTGGAHGPGRTPNAGPP